MQLFHSSAGVSATFDESNLVSAAGLVPAMALAVKTGLGELTDQRLSLPGDFGANAGLKVTALVGGMVAGADSIDDMAVLRHGGMKKLFTGTYAPSTLGSFLRTFTFGHVRQLDAIASRWLTNLQAAAPIVAGIDEYALMAAVMYAASNVYTKRMFSPLHPIVVAFLQVTSALFVLTPITLLYGAGRFSRRVPSHCSDFSSWAFSVPGWLM